VENNRLTDSRERTTIIRLPEFFRRERKTFDARHHKRDRVAFAPGKDRPAVRIKIAIAIPITNNTNPITAKIQSRNSGWQFFTRVSPFRVGRQV